MTRSIAATKQILMSDMLILNDVVDSRRFKVSSQPSSYFEALSNQRFVIPITASVAVGESVAINVSNSLSYGLMSVSVSGDYEISVLNKHSTGNKVNEAVSINKNLTSSVDGFGKGVAYSSPVTTGDRIATGIKKVDIDAVCNSESQPSVLVRNTTNEIQIITIIIELFEFGDRPESQLVTFNSEPVLFNGEQVYA